MSILLNAVLDGVISFRFLKESSYHSNLISKKIKSCWLWLIHYDQLVVDSVRIATGKEVEVRIGTLSDIDEAINQISGRDSSKMDSNC